MAPPLLVLLMDGWHLIDGWMDGWLAVSEG